MTADVTYFPDREREMTFTMPEVVSRQEHYQEFAKDYAAGQHATWIGPTQRGKSRMVKESLQRVVSPDLRALVLMGKPMGRERTWNIKGAEETGLHVTHVWPPDTRTHLENMRKGRGRPKNANGWLLAPTEAPGDVDNENALLTLHFGNALDDAYQSVKQQWILVVDEAHQVQVDLKLRKKVDAPLMRGAPDCGVWQSLQRGRWVSLQTYAAPEHVFIFKDKNTDAQQRYSEIGGVDAKYMIQLVRRLKAERVPSGGTISQCAYFRRASDDVRIVDT